MNTRLKTGGFGEAASHEDKVAGTLANQAADNAAMASHPPLNADVADQFIRNMGGRKLSDAPAVKEKTARELAIEETERIAEEAASARAKVNAEYAKTFSIKHFDKREKKGIYSISKQVKSWSQIKDVAETMVKWLDACNNTFNGEHKVAYAVSHCQIADEAFSFFVLNDELINHSRRLVKDTKKNFYFPSRIIVNAEILVSQEKIRANKPKRELVKNADGSVTPKITITEGDVSNEIFVDEACMSFPHRKAKKMKRFFRIKVTYQVPRKLFGVSYLKRVTEEVEGLKAHIFQHEVDHAHGLNMYYRDSK